MLDILPIYLEEESEARLWFRENRYQWDDDEEEGDSESGGEDGFEVFKTAFLEKFGKDFKENIMQRAPAHVQIAMIIVAL
ncbi:hypothetical protein BGZ96_004175, partial [Linnemannia gamsii]